MSYKIGFNRPSMLGNEQKYMLEAVSEGHISGDGVFTARCQRFLQEMLSCKKALLTTSCTDALEMSALLLNIQPGDEVIMPSFNFVSAANAFVLRGAKLVFADIRPDTLNLDEQVLPALITRRTKAIVPVHYAGVGCEMDTISSLAASNNIAIVEDNAHGLCGTYRGKLLGTFGTFATQSFHETKNFSCGEGGALIINDETFIERSEIIREKGTDRSRFFRGQVDKYTWVDIGSSFLPSDLLAAYLLAQLESMQKIQDRRATVCSAYLEQLKDWAAEHGVRTPHVPEHCEQAYHIFYLVAPTVEFRAGLIQHLKHNGIAAVHHYIPLHSSKMGQEVGRAPEGCGVTDYISERLVRLPLYYSLTDGELATVIDAVKQFSMPTSADSIASNLSLGKVRQTAEALS